MAIRDFYSKSAFWRSWFKLTKGTPVPFRRDGAISALQKQCAACLHEYPSCFGYDACQMLSWFAKTVFVFEWKAREIGNLAQQAKNASKPILLKFQTQCQLILLEGTAIAIRFRHASLKVRQGLWQTAQ